MNQLNRREFINALGLSTASFIAPALLKCSDRQTKKLNIILIMADDLGYECLGCNGSSSYKTPVLDKLAETGVRFTHCYSTPLCTPSRVQMMTSKYNFRNYTEFGSLKPNEITFGHILKNAGYATCVAGKWQLAGHYDGSNYKGIGTLPDRAGFDEHCLWQVDKRGSRYWNPLIQQNGEILKNLQTQYGPDVFVEFIADFIERKQNQPFFIYYPMVLTHSPFEHTPDSQGTTEELKLLDKRELQSRFFSDMVSYMDKIIGHITSKLEQLGLRENTLILFTGDNGTHRAITSRLGDQTIQGGKGAMTDAGTHVPLIANWKGTAPEGTVCDDLIDFTDFLPTFINVANISSPSDLVIDGRSFLSQIKGKKGHPREWIFCHYNPKWSKFEPGRFARDKQWKLYDDGRFFDLQDDPYEKNPLRIEQISNLAIYAKQRLQEVLDSMK